MKALPAATLALAATSAAAVAHAVASTTGIAPTIEAGERVVVYGGVVTLRGRVDAASSTAVRILRRRFGTATFSPLALVSVRADGSWAYRLRPQIETTWIAEAGSLRSAAVTVFVRPRVELRRTGRGYRVVVYAARSLDGRRVVLQRRAGKAWRTIARARLSRNARAFRVELPRRVSRIRAFLPRTAAGPGYLAGVSRTLVVRRSG